MATIATTEEIQLRVEEADSAKTARRSAAAQQVGDLAQRRAAVAEQLDEIERQLGTVLAAAHDVIDIDELAQFTDVPAADLTRWLTTRKSPRAKRKRSGSDGMRDETGREPSGATARQASSGPKSPVGAPDTPARVTVEVA